jgi:hypothetical protein
VVDQLNVALATTADYYVAEPHLAQKNARWKAAAWAFDVDSLVIETEH